MASALIPSSQATTSTANTTAGRTGGGNNAAVGSGNDTTMISSMRRICSPTANNGAEAAGAIEMSSNTANTGATNASNGTMQGRPNPIITMSATSGDNTTSPQEGNLTAIGESLSQARIDLLEGCNSVNSGDSNSALMIHGTDDKVLPVYCSEQLYTKRHMSRNKLFYAKERAMGLTRFQKRYMS
jgi:hypothetical protein